MIYYKIINGQTKISQCNTIILDDGTCISNPSHEQIISAGWQVYEPPEILPEPQTEPDYMQVMEAVKKMLSSEAGNLTDEEALQVAALYPTWISKVGEQVNTGERYWYDGKLYKVIQQHTMQVDWTPDSVPALFTEVSIEEWPEIVIPIPSTNPYMSGDKVTYNGNHYICQIDNCVWAPDVAPQYWQEQ